MPPNLTHEFMYFQHPVIGVELVSTRESRIVTADVLIDTGSEVTLFDEVVAARLGIDVSNAPTVRISGVGGAIREARIAEVEIRLLGQPALTFTGEIAFAPEIESAYGNLLALDVLSHFDFALSHANRVGYLGVASQP